MRSCKRYLTLLIGLLISACLLAAPGTSVAGGNDLVLSRLGSIVNDGAGMPIDAIGSNVDFRSLASELGVVLAPRLVEPADTLGFGGFQFTFDMAFTTITSDATYWRALESSPNPNMPGIEHGDSIMPTIGFFARKGIWMPLPSFEIGVGAVHLMDSDMWAAQSYAKFALHEGFHDFPLPSLAVRGGVSRMMGSEQIDLTIASIDVSASKHIGIAGTFSVAPFIGWNWLIIVPRSEVIDRTPNIDAQAPGNAADANLNFVFKDQDDIYRNRLFGGVKLQYYVFTLGLEANVAFAGSSVDDRSGTDLRCEDLTTPRTDCDSTDQAGSQTTITISLGMDF